MSEVPGAMPPQTSALTEALRAHLRSPSLMPLWYAIRQRLARGDDALAGSVTVDLDADGANRLAGLLGEPVSAGNVRVSLADLDHALRTSSAGRGLAAIVTELLGAPGAAAPTRPVSRTDAEDWSVVWAQLDNQLERSDLSDRPWVPSWHTWLTRSGVLDRAGVVAGAHALGHALDALALFDRSGVLDPQPDDSRDHAEWELDQLANRITHNPKGFNDGSLAATLILRAAAFCFDVPAPRTAADRRHLWRLLGVQPDRVSGTVLVWRVRPLGRDRWSAMLRERADLGLVTHLTAHELKLADGARYARPGERVFVCANPLVVEAAADDGLAAPLVCLSGDDTAVGLELLRTFLVGGADVRFHGDFDWPALAVAARLHGMGVSPWRLGEGDYLDAVRSLAAESRQPLTPHAVVETPWDERLASAMVGQDTLVTESAVLESLLADLA